MRASAQEKRVGTSSPELYEGLAGFRLAMRRFLAFTDVVLARAEVTSQQYQAMLVIKTNANAQIVIKELAEQMLLPHNGAVQLVDRLATAGLAERVPSQEDRRSVFIRLSAKGQQVLHELARSHVEELLANEPLLADSLAKLRRLADLD